MCDDMMFSDDVDDGIAKKRCDRIEISDSIIVKQMQCIKGDPGIVSVFLPRPITGTPLIVQGLYPAANASIKISATEIDMLKTLDRNHFTAVVWNDLCVLSSNTNNKIIDQSIIATWDEDREIIEDYYRRLAIHLDFFDPGTIPCIFIAGKTCQSSLEAAIALGIVKRIQELSPLGVTVCEIDGKRIVVLEGRPHPSWHLMTGRRDTANNTFKETILMLNGMARCCATSIITPDTMNASLMSALSIDPETLAKRAEGRAFLTQMLYGDPSGRFPTKHVHLRNVQAHLPDVKAFLLKWCSRGMKVLKAILNSGDLYLDLPSYDGVLEIWFTKLGGAKLFVTFMCGGVAARLGDPIFDAALEKWFNKLGGAKAFVTFICDSVAAKLGDPIFDAALEKWFDKLGGAKAFVTFICDSVAAKLCDPIFDAALEKWFDKLGGAKPFVTFICNSVAAKLGDPIFDAALEKWFDKLGGAKLFITFMCGGVAARLGDPIFDAALEKWFDKLGGAKLFVTFMCNSVAAKLGDPIFDAELEKWFNKLGGAKPFVTFMCNSVAAKLCDPIFDAALEKWFKKLGGAKLFVTFMCDGVAAKLCDPIFEAALEKWLDKLGCAKLFVTFMCNSVAAKLGDQIFDAALDKWFIKLGGAKLFVPFMCNSVASRLTDPRFTSVSIRWLRLLGKEHFCKIFARGGLVKRIVEQPAFEEKVTAYFIKFEKSAETLRAFLIKNDGRKLDLI